MITDPARSASTFEPRSLAPFGAGNGWGLVWPVSSYIRAPAICYRGEHKAEEKWNWSGGGPRPMSGLPNAEGIYDHRNSSPQQQHSQVSNCETLTDAHPDPVWWMSWFHCLVRACRKAQRPPPETPGRLHGPLTNHLNRQPARRGGGSPRHSGSTVCWVQSALQCSRIVLCHSRITGVGAAMRTTMVLLGLLTRLICGQSL